MMMSDKIRDSIVLTALALLMLAQMWMSDLRLSVTSDEIDHLHAGYRYLTCHDFGWNPEHPPLVKLVAALPLLFMHISDPIGGACGLPNNRGLDFHAGHDFVFANSESMLTAARFSTSIFALALLIISWLLAKKLFGPTVAMLSAILIAFEPTILGHGALVTTDVPAALGFVLAVYAVYCYAERPLWTRAVWLGLSVGFALSLKHSTILLAVILPLLLALDLLRVTPDASRKLLLHIKALAIVLAISAMSLWAVYGFRFSGRPADARIWPTEKHEEVHGFMSTKFIPSLIANKVLPEPYLVGLRDVSTVSEIGRPGFLLGRSYHGGEWAYFPVATLIKLTFPCLLLILLSTGAGTFWKAHLREFCFLMIPPGVLMAFGLLSNINIGFRHLMPIIPFLAVFASAGALSLVQPRPCARLALAALLLFHVGTSLHAFPNYLSYSNEAWGGATHTYKYLADSNADWGQAQKMARDYIARTHPESCFFLQAYNERSSDYGIPCGSITEMEDEVPPETFTGTLIVSSSVVDGIVSFDGGVRASRLFRELTPVAKLGGSALTHQGLVWRPLALAAAIAWVVGAVLFAGDVSARAFFGHRLFPIAAPAGGSILIAAWLAFAAAALVGALHRS